MNQSPIAITMSEAVTMSGISRTSLYALIGTGRLPSVKLAGRRLILVDDLRALLESHREHNP